MLTDTLHSGGNNIPEHVEHIEDCKDDGHVTGRQKCREMIHGTIQMPRETLLHEQCRELEHRQQQVLVRLMASHVTRQHPRAVGVTAPLQNIIQFVQHVHPVGQLTLHHNHSTQTMNEESRTPFMCHSPSEPGFGQMLS